MEGKSTGGGGAPAPLRCRTGGAKRKPRVAGLRAKKKTTSKKRTAEQATATEQAPGKKPFTAATATSTAAQEIIASALESDLSDDED
ncbi:hypothetical protein PR002_g30393 [Phytophthora rubi]|uniref:Uncharacterized protein n=1 Tax=Phytophthora rubi TaxID=129364 RepID=A0A6A3GSD3_9STRA|nr:hypothetical protein PR002_g30393 [Phytophthora rubi]